MKIKLIHILPVLILAALFVSAFGYTLNAPSESNTTVRAQDTAVPTDPPVLSTPIVSTVIVPVTGDENTSNANATLLVYILIGIAGLAFLVAIIAVLTRSNQAPSDRTHTH
jgi:hypothetical protein